MLVSPGRNVSRELDGIEAQIGLLPLSLRSWYEEVGQVNLVGRNPRWGYELADPLVVDAPIEFVQSEYDQWSEDRGTEWDQGPFTIDIAPDYLHKANISGGPPYALAVPNAAADGLLLWEAHETTFVNYLRTAFRWAGLPGWDRAAGNLGTAPRLPFRLNSAELLSRYSPSDTGPISRSVWRPAGSKSTFGSHSASAITSARQTHGQADTNGG